MLRHCLEGSLQSYLQNLDDTVKNRVIPPKAREYAFQHWVAFVRCQSADFESEKFRCPLLGCNIDLGCLASYLQHITVCPQLKSSHYWCPIHQRAETFIFDENCLKRPLRTCIGSGISKAASRMLNVVRFPIPSPRKRACRQSAYLEKRVTAELEVPTMPPTRGELSSDQFRSHGLGILRLELTTPEPPSELATPDPSVPELTSQYISHELPSSNRNSIVPSIPSLDSDSSYPSDSASIRSATPKPDPFARPNPPVPGFNTVQSDLSTPDPLWTPDQDLPFNLTSLCECYAGQRPEFFNIMSRVTGTSGPCANRSSEPPRLSIVTTPDSCVEHGHPSNAAAPLSNTEVYVGNRAEPPSCLSVEDHSQLVETLYNVGFSPICSPSFNRFIFDRKTALSELDGLVSPQSANSALDSPPFDWSAFESPISNMDKYQLQKTYESLVIESGLTPVAPGSSPDQSQLHCGREYSISAAHDPRTFHPTAPQIPFTHPGKTRSLELAAWPDIPRQYCVDLTEMKVNPQELERQEDWKLQAQQTTGFCDEKQFYRVDSNNYPVQTTLHRSTGVPFSGLRPLKPALVETGAAKVTPAGSLLCGSPVASIMAGTSPSTPASSLFSDVSNQRARRRDTLVTSVDGSISSSPTSSHPAKSDEPHSPKIGIRCPDCNFSFRGSRTSDCQNNLKRHLRDLHNRPPKMPCTYANCSVQFTRSDNRLKHWRKQHGFEVVGQEKKRKKI